ncbi:MAG TPA: hypothetical protein VMQ83_10875 [Gammaproteobacteria bacterium]|nr:hypothetical protein [Gammaproteobacteria bacterium]
MTIFLRDAAVLPSASTPHRPGVDSIPFIDEPTDFAHCGSVQQTFIRHAAHDEQTLTR